MPNSAMSPDLLEAISRVRASMPQSDLDIADRMMEISGKHLETMRDRAFASRFRRMKRSLVAHFAGDTKQHRILIVTGDSHSGKTSMIEHTLDSDTGFEPYPDSDGNMTIPILRMEAPSPCYLVNLALEGLRVLGYPMDARTLEKVAWIEFRKRLKQRKVLVLFVDEAQHTVNSTNRVELQKLRDIFKHMVQMKDWPIRIILAGVDPLSKLREDRQIRTRSMTLHMGPITPAYAKNVQHWVNKVVTAHAGLEIADFLGGDFPHRIIHSCGNCFGSIIQLTLTAVEDCLLDGKKTVDAQSFANAYKTLTDCLGSENIFTAKKWRTLEGARAKIEVHPEEDPVRMKDEESCRSEPRLKPLRGGERPN